MHSWFGETLAFVIDNGGSKTCQSVPKIEILVLQICTVCKSINLSMSTARTIYCYVFVCGFSERLLAFERDYAEDVEKRRKEARKADDFSTNFFGPWFIYVDTMEQKNAASNRIKLTLKDTQAAHPGECIDEEWMEFYSENFHVSGSVASDKRYEESFEKMLEAMRCVKI